MSEVISTQEEIKSTIEQSKGKIFTVYFIKKDGTPRTMVARLGVKKHLRGGESTTKHIDHLLTAFDMQKQQYRNINLSTIKWVKANGEVREVV